MKVVIGVDGSDLAYQAVRFMGRLLSAQVDDLVLFFSPPAYHLSSKTAISQDVLESATLALAAGVFDKAKQNLPADLREVTSTIPSAFPPADGLVRLAEGENADLVVVGSKGAARKFPFVLGSTARKVVHHTDRPVLVVRGNENPQTERLKVVIACDEDRWVDVGGVLREFSWPSATEVTLLHVTEALGNEFVDAMLDSAGSRIPNSTQMVSEYRAAIEKRKEVAESRLKSLQKEAPPVIQVANIEVVDGEVVEQILERVEQEEADLLVVSSRKLTALGRMLGSVTESLLTRCPCSLLIVHDHKEAKAV